MDMDHRIIIPEGLHFAPDFKECELIYKEDELPFMWLQEIKKNGEYFLVFDPIGTIPDYILEINDQDESFLDLQDESDVLVVCPITIRSQNVSTPEISANLASPIVINRRTRVGRHLLLANFEKYPGEYELDPDKS